MKFPGKRLIVEYKNRRARKNVTSLWGDINIKEIARAVEDDTAAPSDIKKDTPPAPEQETPVATAAEKGVVPALTGGRILAAIPPATPFDKAPKQRQAKKANIEFAASARHEGAAKPTSQAGADNSPRIASATDTTLSPKIDPQRMPRSGPSDLSEETATAVAMTDESSVPVAKPAHRKSAPVELDRKTRSVKARTVNHAQRQAPRQPSVGFYQISADINEDIAKLKKENTELKRSLIKQLQAENRRLEKMILRASSPIETR
jgi:hypothetical protein